MKAELLNRMGDDLMVVNAARVSMDKESTWAFEDAGDEFWDFNHVLSDPDKRLINYLAKHKHWTPFAHPQLQFRIKAPIPIARQMFKHKVGAVENEVSRRYVDSTPELYMPDTWRKRAANVKQGSSPIEIVEVIELYGVEENLKEAVQQHYDASIDLYDAMIAAGVCPEQARFVLPQAMQTQWYLTGSLYYFWNLCKLRRDSHAQPEIQWLAQQISDQIQPVFPVSWTAMMEHNL